ncbi:MAG: ParB/Srx family N-terminal domain-containing protein [Oscillospiraceae bacterium]
MKTVKMKLSELRKPKRNVRIHSDKQIKEFTRSIEMFGQLRPIVIDENNVILAGNGLFEAMMALGRKEADCYQVVGLTETAKKKLMLADNRIFNLGIDDLKAFDEIVMELDGDFDIPGFDVDLLETLTLDLYGADNLMAGYGIISDDSKDDMQKASERYEKEGSEFANGAIEYIPTAGTGNASGEAGADGQVNSSDTDKKSTTGATASLQLQYLVCPKCGEQIWV